MRLFPSVVQWIECKLAVLVIEVRFLTGGQSEANSRSVAGNSITCVRNRKDFLEM